MGETGAGKLKGKAKGDGKETFGKTFVAVRATTGLVLTAELTGINLLEPTGHVMHQQFNIQQLYVLPTLYLCVLYLSENKQRLVPLTA